MCTLTWFTSPDGYELFFNRDESVLRQRAQVPSVCTSETMTYIAPTDTDAGGTWISVNERGVTVCLLNHYQFEQIKTYKDWVSRGELVRRFAATFNLVRAEQQFAELKLDDYRAFRMFIILPDGQNRLLVWDGHSPRVEVNVTKPKSSSSVDARHVKQLRKELYLQQGLDKSNSSQAHIAFHRSHVPNPSKESVCMHRPEARTVSLSHIKVNRHTAAFAYIDGSPCEHDFGGSLSIARVNADAVLDTVSDRALR